MKNITFLTVAGIVFISSGSLSADSEFIAMEKEGYECVVENKGKYLKSSSGGEVEIILSACPETDIVKALMQTQTDSFYPTVKEYPNLKNSIKLNRKTLSCLSMNSVIDVGKYVLLPENFSC